MLKYKAAESVSFSKFIPLGHAPENGNGWLWGYLGLLIESVAMLWACLLTANRMHYSLLAPVDCADRSRMSRHQHLLTDLSACYFDEAHSPFAWSNLQLVMKNMLCAAGMSERRRERADASVRSTCRILSKGRPLSW